MAVDINKIAHGLAVNNDSLVMDKGDPAQSAGNYVSLWRATGQPGQGAIPGEAEVCNSLTGCFRITNQTPPMTSYLAYLEFASGSSAMTLEIHDRLVHMGGLSGTSTASQTVGIDLSTLLSTDNLANRIGSSAYDDVQWWLEWYTATGSTAITCTVSVTYNDASTGTIAVSLAATRPVGVMIPLNGLIPAAKAGSYIRAVTSVQNSATTGNAGSFGVTATRKRGSVFAPILNMNAFSNWADLPISEIPNYSCLFVVMLTSTSSSGSPRGVGKVIHIDPS